MVAEQLARELQSVNKYIIFPPSPVSDDVKLTIVKQLPTSKHVKPKPSNTRGRLNIPGLPHTNDKIDVYDYLNNNL